MPDIIVIPSRESGNKPAVIKDPEETPPQPQPQPAPTPTQPKQDR